MIKEKQIAEFETLLNDAYVNVIENDDKTITLAVRNGFSLTFSVTDKILSGKGNIGKQGQRGVPGLSAAQLAVQQGFATTEEEWLQTLIGEKGEAGKDGKDGSTNDIVDIGVKKKVSVKQGISFNALWNNNELTLTLPVIPVETKTERYRVEQCTITNGDAFSVKTLWLNNAGFLDITLPAIKNGERGKDGVTINGTSPVLGKVTVNRDDTMFCSGGGITGINNYTFHLSAAKQGDKGATGETGAIGAVLGSLNTVVTEQKQQMNSTVFAIIDNKLDIRTGSFSLTFNGNRYEAGVSDEA